MNPSWLEEMDQLRYDDPKSALAALLPRAGSMPAELESFFLGVCGSTYRNLAGQSRNAAPVLRRAAEYIDLALWIARRQGNALATADLLLRQSYVVSEDGSYAESLVLAERANAIFDRLGNSAGRGKALADQGMFLYYLERPNEALRAYAAALALLTDSEQRWRCSAYQGSGVCFLQLAQPHKALEYAGLALQSVPDSLAWAAKLRWFQGKVLIELEDFQGAATVLSEVVTTFHGIHYGETALVSCDLVRAQLCQGDLEAAWQTAATVRQLIIPLSGHRAAAAALASLLRGGRQALTLPLIAGVKSTLEKARERHEWRSLTVTS